MTNEVYYQQQSYDDDEHLIAFNELLFNQLLCQIKKVPFHDIIHQRLTFDDTDYHKLLECHSLTWLYTADRIQYNHETIYTFRFPNPCHPDYYQSFITKYHPLFALTNQTRHRLTGWYLYTGNELPKRIGRYLNIGKVINETFYKAKIFINNDYERLDIEFYFRSGNHRRITITFEPGYPATVRSTLRKQ